MGIPPTRAPGGLAATAAPPRSRLVEAPDAVRVAEVTQLVLAEAVEDQPGVLCPRELLAFIVIMCMYTWVVVQETNKTRMCVVWE